MTSLRGKVAVVTGTSSGVGKALVHTTGAHRRVTAVGALLAPHPKDLSCRSLTAMTTLARKWRNWQTRRIQDRAP